MEEEKSSKFHITMFPWFAFGHMTPFLHLSNRLAERGHTISFLLPKKAQTQLESYNLHPDLITFHTLTVPHVDGLPPGTETASDIPIQLQHHLVTAMDLTRNQVESFIKARKPDFVFFDFSHWIPEITSSIDGVKSVNYTIVCAAWVAIALVPARQALTEDELAVPPPGYPSSKVVLRRHEARQLSALSNEFGIGYWLKTRLLVEELKVGVEVEREENGWFSKENLCKSIKSVMDKDSEVGCLVKKNHAKWKEVLVSPGFMSGYIDKFVQNLEDLKKMP